MGSKSAGGGAADLRHSGIELGASARKTASMRRPVRTRISEPGGFTVGPKDTLESVHNFSRGGPPAGCFHQ